MPSGEVGNGRSALIFGASGITGWALMNEAVTYPSPETFARIIGLTNRPLSLDDAHLPKDPRIELYSGIDLTKDNVEEQLKKVPGIATITHIYFAAYTGHGTDFQTLKKINVEILKHTLDAVEALCPQLSYFTLQTGGKVSPLDSCSLRGTIEN